jgi:hypothetical protein
MSYGRYKRALLLKRVEVTTARMQKVPNHGLRKVEARLEQRSRIMQERQSTTDNPLSLKEEAASAYVDTHAMEKD